MTKLTADLETELTDVLTRACAAAGLNPDGARLMRYTMNAVYLLPADTAVVRIRARADTVVQRSVEAARWLGAAGAPVTRLLDCAQPVRVNEYLATFWEAAATSKQRWQGADLAAPLRYLHQLAPENELPEWDPFFSIKSRIARAGDRLAPEDREWVLRERADLEAAYAVLRPSLQQGVIHADAHIGNLLRDRSGQPVLCDLDSVVRGPIVQDLVPTALDAIRFGRTVRHRTLAFAYGLDVTEHPAWPVLRRIRELMTTTAGLANGDGRSGVFQEGLSRLRTLQAGEANAQWRVYTKV